MKIAIDAGHGLNTPGKRCLKSIDSKQTREWFLNARIANYLVEYLKNYNCEVKRVDDTTGKTDISLGNRCKVANNWGADFYLSIHHNAGVNGGSGGGVVIYTYRNASSETHKKRDIIYNEVIAQNGLSGNRSEPTLTSGFYVIKNTNMPAVLIECGFMDSTVDTPKILTDDFAKKTAKGLCNGLVKALSLKPIKQSVKTEKEDEEMKELTQAEFDKFMDNYLANRTDDAAASWSAKDRQWAEKLGIVMGNGDGKMGYKELVTKEQVVAMLSRFADEIVTALK